MKKSVVTFGELLLRLVTRGYERFVQSEWGVARYTGGDAFTGGLIYTMMSGCLRRKAIDFAAAAGCLKHSIPGDFILVSLDEVHALVGGDESHAKQAERNGHDGFANAGSQSP